MQNPEVPKETRALLVETLKQVAVRKRISNRQIADYAGFSESHISRFFTNKFPPTLDNFISIASAVGVKLFISSKDDDTDLNKAFEVEGKRPENEGFITVIPSLYE